MESWYFAYGSNLWMDQMIERTDAIGHPENGPRIARLANHRLVFQRLDAADEAFANILCPGDGVLGVVYRCSQTDLERLDQYEGGYEHRSITVTDQHGEVLAAIAYVLIPAQAAITGRPTAAYLERIVGGAGSMDFPRSTFATSPPSRIRQFFEAITPSNSIAVLTRALFPALHHPAR